MIEVGFDPIDERHRSIEDAALKTHHDSFRTSFTMTPKTEAHPSSVNARFANHLASNKDAILDDWLKRVRADPEIATTETLNTIALKNHLPQIFDDLTETLRRYGSETVAEQAVRDAEEHGATRLRQGYELPELLRELKHLRSVFIFYLRTFEDINPDDGMAARLFISTTLHAFLDEMIIDATEEYLWTQRNLQDPLSLEQSKC